jgi:hypothetical protein
VESYDASAQTCDVLPQLKRQMPDGDGGFTIEDLPVLPGVPVCHPRGGGFFASFPLQKGDFVLVVFAERPIGNWRQKGQASNPGDNRMHPLAGAMAIPCNLYPSSQALQDVDGTNMVIGKDGTSGAQVVITPTGIELGGNAAAVALASKVKAWFDAFNAAVTGWTPVANDGGAALKAALSTLISGTPSTDPSAQNVKAT